MCYWYSKFGLLRNENCVLLKRRTHSGMAPHQWTVKSVCRRNSRRGLFVLILASGIQSFEKHLSMKTFKRNTGRLSLLQFVWLLPSRLGDTYWLVTHGSGDGVAIELVCHICETNPIFMVCDALKSVYRQVSLFFSQLELQKKRLSTICKSPTV